MKNIMRTLMTMAMVMMVYALSAQTAIDDLYKRYAGKEGFTSINISPEMFGMLSGFDTNDSSENAQEAQNVMEQLTGLKMLVYEAEDGVRNDAFMNELRELSSVKGYTEMMSVDSEDEIVKFLAKKGEDGRVSEMLMIVMEEDEAVVMSMTGSLDMKSIQQISNSLNIGGMEKLEGIDE